MRFCTIFRMSSLGATHYYHMSVLSELGQGESPRLNKASLLEALIKLNLLSFVLMQGTPPMIKAILLEANSLMDSQFNHNLGRDGVFILCNISNIRILQVIIYTFGFTKTDNEKSQLSKGGYNPINNNKGRPKSINTHGIRGITKKIPGNNFLSVKNYSTGSTNNVINKLKNLNERSKNFINSPIDRNLYKIFILDKNFLLLAYNKFKSNPGNMTPGVTPETLDGFCLITLDNLITDLKNESFKFKPARRIYIPKNNGKLRPLSIGSPIDKIIQEAIKMILEAIYEPVFLNVSHGFRPNKSCHTALKGIYVNFQQARWMIEGDFKNCFDSIDHNNLMNLIENKILDRQFTKLIHKCIKAGYMESRVLKHSLSGVPQGSIISPILSNIYLHQLDSFIINLSSKFNKGTKLRTTSEYEKIRYLQNKYKRLGNIDKMSYYNKLLLKMNPYNYHDDSIKKLVYTRYADDWVIGIKGSKDDAISILNLITEFCKKIKLVISENKTKITHLNSKTVTFLGININRTKYTKVKRMRFGFKQRLNKRLRFTVSIDKIRKKLTEAQFIKFGKAYPKFIWLPLNHDLIVHQYNSVFRGYINYYSFVSNYSKMVGVLTLILKRSLAKLLATKFNLKTQKQAYIKFGPYLSGPKISFIKSKYSSNPMDFKIKIKDYIE